MLQMMKFAWDNYKLYAWGKNELRPLTRNGHLGNMFGECPPFARGSKRSSSIVFFHDPWTFLSGEAMYTKIPEN